MIVVAVTASQVVGIMVERPAPQHPGASAAQPTSGRGPASPKSKNFTRSARSKGKRKKGSKSKG
jgi:hypothetical protein